MDNQYCNTNEAITTATHQDNDHEMTSNDITENEINVSQMNETN